MFEVVVLISEGLDLSRASRVDEVSSRMLPRA